MPCDSSYTTSPQPLDIGISYAELLEREVQWLRILLDLYKQRLKELEQQKTSSAAPGAFPAMEPFDPSKVSYRGVPATLGAESNQAAVGGRASCFSERDIRKVRL